MSSIEFIETQISKEFERVVEALNKVLWAETIMGGMAEEYTRGLAADQREDKAECEQHMLALANLISVYLERVVNMRYLAKFEADLRPRMTDPHRMYKSEYVDGPDELCSTLTPDIRTFLAPFEFAHSSEIDRLLKVAGVRYLENILRNTATIILDLKRDPQSEPEVYNAVKPVIYAVFPDAKGAGSNFLKTAKEYKPDILIPEIRVAVEYKYAQSEKRLKTLIDQICADQKGYSGDSDYALFYAVFYVTADFWGPARFAKAWEDCGFPKDWRGIYVVGC